MHDRLGPPRCVLYHGDTWGPAVGERWYADPHLLFNSMTTRIP